MKHFFLMLFSVVLFMGCQEKKDNSANQAFAKNSKTVMANIQNWQNETPDYSMYSDKFVMRDTGVNGKDSLSLDEMKENDKMLFKNFDFKFLTDPIVLLPGVNPETKEPDGSVRYYGNWEVTIPATDSTKAKSAVLKYYESFDFDDDGKIIYQQGYGDFGGLMKALYSDDDKEDMEE